MSTTKPRLIDANALNNKLLHGIERTWGKEGAKVFATIIAEIESSPTVETTDDVLARVFILYGNVKFEMIYPVWICSHTDDEGKKVCQNADTPLEALKKLEASLNQK